MGYLDTAQRTAIVGWAYEPDEPNRSIWLEAVIDDAPPIRFLANFFRHDLVEAGFGTGRYGFTLQLAHRLNPLEEHVISVRRASDGRDLIGSPKRLERALAASPEVRAQFEAIFSAEIEAAADGPELIPLTHFLVEQLDRLLQMRAERENGTYDRDRFRTRWADTLEGGPVALDRPADMRPWALLIEPELSCAAPILALVRAVQALGHHVAMVAANMEEPPDSAETLRAMGVRVLARPMHFTVEDVLKRDAGLYRCVMFGGALVAAAHSVNTRLHHPRSRIIARLAPPQAGSSEFLLTTSALLTADIALAATQAHATQLSQLVQGRQIAVADLAADPDQLPHLLAPVLLVAKP
jgi:hypothetical protein